MINSYLQSPDYLSTIPAIMKASSTPIIFSLAASGALAQRGALGGGPGGYPNNNTYFREANRHPNATRSIKFSPSSQSEEQWTWR